MKRSMLAVILIGNSFLAFLVNILQSVRLPVRALHRCLSCVHLFAIFITQYVLMDKQAYVVTPYSHSIAALIKTEELYQY